ncbi:hypothetical protein EfmAA290_26160 [Enterococcus faecium]|nr:hypothetical protein EfmAA290_26160 [Enterococcus faecium]
MIANTTEISRFKRINANYHESVNHTLDYAYSDFCISQVAKVLEEEDSLKLAKNPSAEI